MQSLEHVSRHGCCVISCSRFFSHSQDGSSASGAEAVDDLGRLPLLHEPAVLLALQRRFDERIVYTFSGPVLLAVNPFQEVCFIW